MIKKISITDALDCVSPFKAKNCGNCNGSGYVSSGGPDVNRCYFCQGTGRLNSNDSYARGKQGEYNDLKKSNQIDDLYDGE